jgi:hypothetical protein
MTGPFRIRVRVALPAGGAGATLAGAILGSGEERLRGLSPALAEVGPEQLDQRPDVGGVARRPPVERLIRPAGFDRERPKSHDRGEALDHVEVRHPDNCLGGRLRARAEPALALEKSRGPCDLFLRTMLQVDPSYPGVGVEGPG